MSFVSLPSSLIHYVQSSSTNSSLFHGKSSNDSQQNSMFKRTLSNTKTTTIRKKKQPKHQMPSMIHRRLSLSFTLLSNNFITPSPFCIIVKIIILYVIISSTIIKAQSESVSSSTTATTTSSTQPSSSPLWNAANSDFNSINNSTSAISTKVHHLLLTTTTPTTINIIAKTHSISTTPNSIQLDQAVPGDNGLEDNNSAPQLDFEAATTISPNSSSNSLPSDTNSSSSNDNNNNNNGYSSSAEEELGEESDNDNANEGNIETIVDDIEDQTTTNIFGGEQQSRFVLKLNASTWPQPFVTNCTDVEFNCEIHSLASNDLSEFAGDSSINHLFNNSTTIWWTFRGQNVSSSTLPGGRVLNRDNYQKSVLSVECAQFGLHDGDYRCHSSTNIGRQQINVNSSNWHFEISVLMLEPVEPTNRTIRQLIDERVELRCQVHGYPKPHIVWQRYDPATLITTDVEPDGRIDIEDQFLPGDPELLQNIPSNSKLKSFQSILRFETLKRSDNGTYMCRAIGSQKSEKPKAQDFNVIVLEVPEIHIEKIEIENKTSAVVAFVVDYDGNLPIEQYVLELRNYSDSNSTWSVVVNTSPSASNIVTKHNYYSTVRVDDLVHAANYGFRLAALNQQVGQSEWSTMNITVPPDVPSQIYNVHLLSKSNETLLFGWRRPLHDNGAAITQFDQILKDVHEDVIVWNQTINNTQSRNKHMSYFSNLQPGTYYSFQIRACSHIGCGEWSSQFEAMTSDGHSDPPLNIRLECVFDRRLTQTNATITWEPPTNPRGLIIGYNISLRGHSTYSSRHFMESFEQSYQVQGNQTFEHRVILRPNSNYTARLCAINKSGCGQLSHLTSMSMCQSSPTVPSEFPAGIRLERIGYSSASQQQQPLTPGSNNNQNGDTHRKETAGVLVSPFSSPNGAQERQLKLHVPRISERNGPFRCIRIIVIRLPTPPQRQQISQPQAMLSSESNSSINNSLNSSLTNGDGKHESTTMTNDPQQTFRDIFNQYLLNFNKDDDPSSSLSSNNRIPLTTYREVHSNKQTDAPFIGAYIAKEFTSDNIPSEIIIGDGKVARCYDDALEYDLKSRVKVPATARPPSLNHLNGEDGRSPRRIKNYENPHLNESSLLLNFQNEQNFAVDGSRAGINEEFDDVTSSGLVEDRELLPNTYYSAAIEVTVMAVNHTLLVEQSPWVEPIRTEPIVTIIPQSSHSLSETTTGILYGTFCGLILITALFFSVLCFLKRKATETTPVLLDDERIGLTSFIRRTIGRKRSKDQLFYQLNFNSTQSIRKWAQKPIPIQNLVAVFQQRRTNSDFLFQAEFESLPESFADRTTNASDATENVGKNRYPDIKSYDQTRVQLLKIDDQPGTDYINADFVYGYKNEQKRFICAQGPTSKTVPDFWRMIYEQQCCIIVMLTGIEEQGRIKCAQYWSDMEDPNSGQFKPIEFECNPEYRFQVQTIHRREYSDYVTRRFSLRKIGDNASRDVLHFHFVAWKDFLAPDQPSWLLRFIKRVNEHYCADRGPILVHCSAGVGRTGTFIAIDSLIYQIDQGIQEINVFNCVSKLRYQRNYLVQSLRQYIFVYRAIMEYVEFGDTEIEAAHVRDHYKQLKEQKTDSGNGVFTEFEKLNEVFEDQKSCIVGSLDANKSKNRYEFIIPYDVNRVILNPSQDTCYINASFIQGYDHTLSFIVAQDPMERTVNEFWWMIAEHAVTTLVMLAELGDQQNKCHCYWPSGVDETYDCDFVRVKLIEEQMFQYYVKRVLDVTKKKTNKSHLVTQYQFLSWKSGVVVPESTKSLITLTDVVLLANDDLNDNNNSENNNNINDNNNGGSSVMVANHKKLSSVAASSSSSPILVHCSGGGDRSSVFVSFASLVRQLHLEERVDVFQTARYTKSQRQCMLQTIAQYDFLYRCLIDYMDSHHICNNGDTQL